MSRPMASILEDIQSAMMTMTEKECPARQELLDLANSCPQALFAAISGTAYNCAWDVRGELCRILGEAGSSECIEALGKLALGESPAYEYRFIRHGAAEGLEKANTDRANELLEQVKLRHPETAGHLYALIDSRTRLLSYADSLSLSPSGEEELRRTDMDAWKRYQHRKVTETANQAFRAKDYAQVVALLEPVEDCLTPSQVIKLKYARKRQADL